jgi:hypothetical protein
MKHSSCSQIFRTTFAALGIYIFVLATVLANVPVISAQPIPAQEVSIRPPAIIIGFVGGFIAHDNLVHSEVQLAARLRKEYPAGLDVETFESYHGDEARQKIHQLLDENHDGTLTQQEKQGARIIIYGHSWGGAESVYLARALEKDDIPVMLLLQVDTVSRPESNDTIIPANVAEAANFYQSHGLLRGQHDIRAADAAHTRIIGNFQFDYEKSSLQCSEYPWYDRLFFTKPHTQIECDPVVWDRVESLIRSSLLPLTPVPAAR